MNISEETIDATLDTNGQLRLFHVPKMTPGPVQVTIRATNVGGAARGLTDVIREISTEQRTRGFLGRTEEEVQAEREQQTAEDLQRDEDLDAARQKSQGDM